ncbi:MAG: protein-glutamate O-methyltransferase CheR [Tardiphaga sp.]|jgi:chemotaxis protein methyltransferase CheR|nr:protein-glutamate O-methyltransferase CheR [Tardiphaga sp.]MDB5548574.1 protein-glutamate O-methyltransferase CheR [Tardiphaga sp.]MDB5573289.1 protein-glutamate O-methyltransferase CheR [Tardiphaga sp.]MDB5626337.1 protein-glutamate O-methyltransferase CheR [Tardiphaga sp.]MDB5630820.1 protein-glutamate O-methyltransferase CheR [Tardiphaga sp.]
MTPHDYTFLQGFLKDRSGLILSNKEYLVQGRLEPLAKKHGLNGISDLVEKIKSGKKDIETVVVEAMTTNETSFFRDKNPFDQFSETVVPRLVKARATKKSLRIWCAAGSTGQEPYSIAMCLKEMGALLKDWRIEITATDLSREVLAKSEAGRYSQFEVQRGLPIKLLMKYFQQSGETWQINADIRAMVKHKQFNLLSDFGALGRFDIIFCRNILIYFDEPTKTGIYKRLAKALEPDGLLALGAAETMIGLTNAFVPSPGLRGFYAPNPAAAA